MIRFLPLLMLAVLLPAADLRLDEGAPGAAVALRRLQTTVSVLHITAHPDDEDSGLLTYLARGRGFRVGLLTLNRGEGGANLAGSEMGDALGVLRTEELLAAGRIYGVQQMFTRTADFGFSKRMDETLEHWGQETVLRDVVRAVRQFRPDIIVARFHGAARDGHGNHQTAGLMAKLAFAAAADAKQFPEQIAEGLPVWQAKKLYLSTRPNEANTLRLNTGEWEPLIGMTWRELGALGYREHRTQGMAAVPAPKGEAFSTLRLTENRTGPVGPEKDILDGMSSMQPVAAAREALVNFRPQTPWTVAPLLAAGIRQVRSALASAKDEQEKFLLRIEEEEFNRAMNTAMGLTLDAVVDPGSGAPSPFRTFETFPVAVPGQEFTATLQVFHPAEVKLEPISLTLRAPAGWRMEQGEAQPLRAKFSVAVPPDAEIDRPHWSRGNELREYLYRIERPEFLHFPFPPPQVTGEFRYRVNGEEFRLTGPLQTQAVDPLKGPQRRSLVVAPPVSVAVTPRTGLLPVGRTEYPVTVEVRGSAARLVSGQVRLNVPQGWTAEPALAPFEVSQPGEVRSFGFKIKPPADVKAANEARIEAIAEAGGKSYREGFATIGYAGLEPRHLFRPAALDLRVADVKIADGLRVGYIAGAGDETANALSRLGVNVQSLGPVDLASADLSRFDSIVVGVRASAVREDFKAHRDRLLKYVENGGHLIVQYQTAEFDEAAWGPYPYKVKASAEEVAEEDAKVTVLEPENPVFQGPNRITAADFEGWVEERGSKFMTEWDPRYKALLESHDREQPPQKGGLLQARYGKGYWTYAAYAFYRQLPAGVPGAWRLFANLLSLK